MNGSPTESLLDITNDEITHHHRLGMADIDESEEQQLRYIIVRSASTVLASASNKLSTWVSLKMDSGWVPHGPPQIHNDGEKFFMIQAMTRL